jgi:hypothetical protein
MSLQAVYEASQDATFQGRCKAAAWSIAAAIIRGETITNNASQSLNTTSCTNFALRLLRDMQVIKPTQMSILMLSNTTIAANPGASTDSDLQWQTKENWLTYVEIG